MVTYRWEDVFEKNKKWQKIWNSFRLIPPRRNTFISRHPYVGIIQIRLSVEGFTFLSACNTSSRLLNCKCIIQLIKNKCKKNIFYFPSRFLKGHFCCPPKLRRHICRHLNENSEYFWNEDVTSAIKYNLKIFTKPLTNKCSMWYSQLKLFWQLNNDVIYCG